MARHLILRAFPESIKQTVYEKQNGNCKKCKKHFEYNQMQGDHITPWSQGGKTVIENCQMLCADCNRKNQINKFTKITQVKTYDRYR